MYSCVSNVNAFNDSKDHLIEHGWRFVEEKLEVQWSSFVGNKACGCTGNCDGSRAGCKNCFRSCKPCTLNVS